MGDLRPNNGGGTPPEDGGGTHRDDLPDLPPEWGTIVIPDDAAELDAEASALRRELRRESRRIRLRSAVGLAAERRDARSLGVPVVIMAVAVITTLLSLFVVTWDHRGSSTAAVGPNGEGNAATATPLVNLTLADAAGAQVRLGGVLPAVFLLVRGCDCAALIAAVAAVAPAPVTVLPVAKAAPCAVGTAPNVRCLADPDGALTGRYPAASGSPAASPSGQAPPGPSTVTAVLVDSAGTAGAPITVHSADDVAAGLAKLAAG
jgi:hypothetical protein